jgi:hypothetical protein
VNIFVMLNVSVIRRRAVGTFASTGVVLCLSVASAADRRARSWVSPDRRVTLSSVKAGRADDLGYRLILNRVGQAPVVVDEYLRDVDVSWSPDSRYVAITDWIGSNVADCYMIDVSRPDNKTSVTDRLPKLREAANSHFYVSCGRWVNSMKIAVQVEGHTDDRPF